MKKFLALIMAAAMMLSCVAFAEAPASILESDPEVTMVLNREINTETKANHVTAWQGEWKLVAAYISEDGIDEYEIEDVEPGFIAPLAEVTMTLEALLDDSANDPATGPIVDQANYWHAHTHDLGGTIVFPEDICEDPYKIYNTWVEWKNIVRGEQDGDFNYGPAKIYLKGEDDYLHWNEITGMELDEIEEFKYLGLNADGQLILCSATKNIVTNEKGAIMFAYVFEKVVAEEAAVAE